jgi:hypothetical protein
LLEFAKDKDDYTRAWAAIALLRINPSDEFAKGLALECLRPERPRTLRSSTLYLILGMHGEAAIFEKDLRRLTSDQDKIVSMWSRQALKSIGAKEVQAGSGASSAH